MKTNRIFALLFALGVVTVGFSPAKLNAQSMAIPWYTIGGGGGVSSTGSFELAGTVGQPDAGSAMTGGSFTLTGGYWAAISDEGTILLGDVNGDGVVNLLDVSPFVEAITGGTFIPEADINGDGVVSLLDVAPFIDLLTA